MAPELLASLSAIILSLLFSYIPDFANWYQPLSADLKRIIMLGLLVLVALVSFALACANLVAAIAIACTLQGAWALFQVFTAAAIANQVTFLISPKGKS